MARQLPPKLKQIVEAKKMKELKKVKRGRVYPEKIKRERVIPPKFEKFIKSASAKKDIKAGYPRTVVFTKSSK
jgi:hypothetical protein